LALRLPREVKTITTYLARKLHNNFQLPNYFDRDSLSFGCFGYSDEVVLSQPDCNRILEKKWCNNFNKRSASDIYAPNRLGFIGRVAGYSGLFVATGFGGTAFKFALAIGNHVANAIEAAW
jgi:hypothetical protein